MRCRELVSVAELTSTERVAFVNAVLALKAAPSKIAAAAAVVATGGGTPNRYDDYVWMHSTVGARAHFGSAFGPWHREFLRQFEFDLRQVSGNSSIVIPYWDWTTGRTPASPNWPFVPDLLGGLGNTTGLVTDGPFSNPATWRMNIRRNVFRDDNLQQVQDTNLQLRRRPAAVDPGFSLPTAANARTGMAQTTPYDAAPFNEAALLSTATTAIIQGWIAASFRKFLEWVLHNGPHTWIGGEDNWTTGNAPVFIAGPMAIPAVAVNDPVFWLHHCNVDRLWSTWQQRHSPGAYAPASGADPGHNLNDEMLHFETPNAGNFNTPLRGRPANLVDSRGTLDIWNKSDLPLITLVTPSVDFGDVPADLTTDWPVKFDVRTCRPVKLRITAVGGANFSIPAGQGDVIADHDHAHDPVRANVFVEFHALGTANVVQPGTVTIGAFIDDTEGYFTGTVGAEFQVGTFNVGLSARPVPAPRAAVAFVLDRSGSMSDSAGPAGTKYDLLRSSLQVVAAVMRNDDAIGLVSYDDQVATLTSPPIRQMGTVSPPGAGRAAVDTAIVSGDLAPRGATAIGLGMIAGAQALQTVQTDTNYPIKAMVVMTDGNQNTGPSVTSPTVTSAIAWFSNSVYALGLGDETNVSAPTLGSIARFQLITGNITSNEQRFVLTKYFLQILAQISDSAVIVDPQGELRPGMEHRIPFDVGDSDVSMDVVALCPMAIALDLSLEAPDGTIIQAGSGPNVALQIDSGDEFYRIRLPAIPANPTGTHAGRWTAILRIRDFRRDGIPVDVRRAEPDRQTLAGIDRQALASVAARGALPYQLFVQSYSNLKMNVEVKQDSFAPGTVLTLLADLLEYRLPVDGRARVMVEVTEPDGREVLLQLDEVAPGRFQGEHATTRKGIYQCRFRASGVTRGGKPFQREDTRTAAVHARLVGGTGDLSGSDPAGGDGDRKQWCTLTECLLREPSIVRFLRRQKVDPREIEACLKRYCAAPGMTHALPYLSRLEDPVSLEAERLREEILALRAELRKDAATSHLNWDELFVAAPEAKPVKREIALPASVREMDGHDHHNRALPFMVLDNTGAMRLIEPGRGGHEGHGGHGGHGEGGHEPGGSTPGHAHGHDHRGHDHAPGGEPHEKPARKK